MNFFFFSIFFVKKWQDLGAGIEGDMEDVLGTGLGGIAEGIVALLTLLHALV